MKWSSKVDDKTKQKIELLYRQFDKFIEQNHASNNPDDTNMVKQWTSFKQVIQKNPTDFETMHNYISNIGENQERQNKLNVKDLKGTVRSNSPYSPTQKPGKLDVSKIRMKKMTGDLIAAINKNSRELFRA